MRSARALAKWTMVALALASLRRPSLVPALAVRRRPLPSCSRTSSSYAGRSRVVTPALPCHAPERIGSGAKRRHDLSGEEPHLLHQQIRVFILEEADVTKGQGEMLEPALSKALDLANHLVGASRDDVVALA